MKYKYFSFGLVGLVCFFASVLPSQALSIESLKVCNQSQKKEIVFLYYANAESSKWTTKGPRPILYNDCISVETKDSSVYLFAISVSRMWDGRSANDSNPVLCFSASLLSTEIVNQTQDRPCLTEDSYKAKPQKLNTKKFKTVNLY
jgi:hypothetical protein